MRVAHLSLAALLGIAFPAGQAQSQPSEEGPDIKVVTIWNRQGTSEDEVRKELCERPGFPPTDVVVHDGKAKHCVGGGLVEHHVAHEKYPQTLVEISVGRRDAVVWRSAQEFSIVRIDRHDPDQEENPFTEFNPSNRPSRAFWSGPAKSDTVNRRYKISFRMQGRLIDPDLACVP